MQAMRGSRCECAFTFPHSQFRSSVLIEPPGSFITVEVREGVLEAGVWAIGAARSLLCNMTSKISWVGQMTGAALFVLRIIY